MTAELQVVQPQSMEVRPSSGLALSFAEMAMRVTQLDQFYREVMCEGTDYGKIPGTDKPTLYQPGAQMLDQIFGYVPTFEVTPSSVIDWARPIPFFHYVVLCRLVSRRSGETVAEGIGSCNSYEDKYRWRNAKRACPSCKAESVIKGQDKFGGGWICFKKVGGCGAKWPDGDAVIESQQAGRVENEDSASLENTISKMAQKRAHIAATLNATGASRIFTQDIEDLPQFQQATVVQAVSTVIRPDAPGAEDAPFGPEDVAGPAVSTSNAGTTAPPKNVAAPVATNSRPRPEPNSKENARAREMVGGRPTLIATLAQRIRSARDLGGDFSMPKAAQLQTLTDADLERQIADLDAAIAAAKQEKA